jgi:hypothetical protein
MMFNYKKTFNALVLCCLWIICVFRKTALAESLSAKVAIEKEEVFVGESFIFQIHVQGHDAPDAPDMSGVTDFTVQEMGGQQNSRSSVSIINGRMTQEVSRGYIFSYKLTPKRAGSLTIPSIYVIAEGKEVRTQPVTIRAEKPKETKDFKLRMELSSTKCYVGQPITLDVNWYIGKDVEKFQFHMPVLSDNRFAVKDVDISIDPHQKNHYLSIPLEDGEVIGKKGRKRLDGEEFLTVNFKKILIPKTSGVLTIPQGTVACDAVTGYKTPKRQSHSFGGFFDDRVFDSFFDDGFFGRRKKAIYKKFVIPSNEPVLTVLDLPTKGRPSGFTGLVGNYNIVANATPTEVNVGDPITLSIQVAGSDYVDDVELPPLDQQLILTRDFKIPAEMAPGKIEGPLKTFTQTFRAKHPDVKEIPPIELPYFDAEQGKYTIARTDPIPLKVKATRVVTAMDAEGRLVAEETKSELESWMEGIAHNYEDLSILENKAHGPAVWLQSPIWMALIAVPPMFYFLLLGVVKTIRWRQADPAAREARQAYSGLVSKLNKLRKEPPSNQVETYSQLLEAIRQYLGSKLRMSAGALTFKDAEQKLNQNSVDAEAIKALHQIFKQCEAGRYAGDYNIGQDISNIIEDTISFAKKTERKLK